MPTSAPSIPHPFIWDSGCPPNLQLRCPVMTWQGGRPQTAAGPSPGKVLFRLQATLRRTPPPRHQRNVGEGHMWWLRAREISALGGKDVVKMDAFSVPTETYPTASKYLLTVPDVRRYWGPIAAGLCYFKLRFVRRRIVSPAVASRRSGRLI